MNDHTFKRNMAKARTDEALRKAAPRLLEATVDLVNAGLCGREDEVQKAAHKRARELLITMGALPKDKP